MFVIIRTYVNYINFNLLVLSILFFSSLTKGFSQVTVTDSIPKSYELKQHQNKIWDSIYTKWMTTEYPKILKQNKLKINCNGCSSIAMKAIFVIDDSGKLQNYTMIRSKACGKEFSEKLELQFISWFQKQIYPKELFNLKFQVHLGTGLKC